MYKYELDGYIRINKTKARNIFNDGGTVLMVPCNLKPGGPWGLGFEACKTFCDCNGLTFDYIANSNTLYNCDGERGRYLSYYVEKKEGLY